MRTEVTLPKTFVMLPSEVLAIDHKKLDSLPKLVYSIIYTMLNNTNKFFMSNREIGKRCGNYSSRSISSAISKLIDMKLIVTRNVVDKETGAVRGREVYSTPMKNSSRGYGNILPTPHEADFHTPMKQTSNKYISNNRLEEEIRDTMSSSDEHDRVGAAKHVDSQKAKDIVDYLNERTGKHFKPTTKATKTCINARFNDGFTVEDFKTVIDNKWANWQNKTINGTPAINYMRPQTLFGTKFESYLNETPIEQQGGYEDGASW